VLVDLPPVDGPVPPVLRAEIGQFEELKDSVRPAVDDTDGKVVVLRLLVNVLINQDMKLLEE
jgi:hypothetical protein